MNQYDFISVIDGYDLNNLKQNGFYRAGFYNQCSNVPTATENGNPQTYGFTLIVTSNDSSNIQQLLLPRANSSSPNSTKPAYRVFEDYFGWTMWNWL